MRISLSAIGIAVVVFVGLIVVFAAAYTVSEIEQVIITQFGRPVGDSITDPGLKFKLPMVQRVNRIEKRVLEWDGDPTQSPTRDKVYIQVDTFARWRIFDPRLYFERLRDERSAQSRLDDILDGRTRNAVANHDLIELIRSTKGRVPVHDESLADISPSTLQWSSIQVGRSKIEEIIFENSVEQLRTFGIELLDIRIKRVNYNEDVREKIYDRMKSERQQIAERFRSEGAGEAARILGNKERDLKKIESEAYKTIQGIKGDADAKATTIYAAAYNQSPQAPKFYEFIKTMETYKETIGSDTTLILSTDSDYFGYLKSIDPSGTPAPSPNLFAPGPSPQQPAAPTGMPE